MTFLFKRYVDGTEMAEDICIDTTDDPRVAMRLAVEMCPKTKGWTTLVLAEGYGAGLHAALVEVMRSVRQRQLVSDVLADLALFVTVHDPKPHHIRGALEHLVAACRGLGIHQQVIARQLREAVEALASDDTSDDWRRAIEAALRLDGLSQRTIEQLERLRDRGGC